MKCTLVLLAFLCALSVFHISRTLPRAPSRPCQLVSRAMLIRAMPTGVPCSYSIGQHVEVSHHLLKGAANG
jgi:hypothetical protein